MEVVVVGSVVNREAMGMSICVASMLWTLPRQVHILLFEAC